MVILGPIFSSILNHHHWISNRRRVVVAPSTVGLLIISHDPLTGLVTLTNIPQDQLLGLAAHFRFLSQGQGPFSLLSSSFREGLVDFTERITLKSLCPGWITSPVADKIVSSSKVSSIPPLPLSAPPSSPWASCCPQSSSPSSTELWGEVS